MKLGSLSLLVGTLSLAGCAVTDYPLITDTDGDGAFVVQTNGKAILVPTSQYMTIWPDQAEELFTMVDQKTNGDQTLTTYASVSFPEDPFGGELLWLDYTYCTPDWTGCAAITAPNPVEDDALFDFRGGRRCDGFRSVETLWAHTSRNRECGRSLSADLSLPEMAELLLSMDRGRRYGEEGYLVRIHRGNTRLVATPLDGGSPYPLPVPLTRAFYADSGRAVVHLGPRVAPLRRYLAELHDRHPGGFRLSVSHRGLESDLLVSFTENIRNPRF